MYHLHTAARYIITKFHEIPSIDYLVMALNGQNSLILRLSKDNDSSTTDDVLINFHIYHHTVVIYTQYVIP